MFGSIRIIPCVHAIAIVPRPRFKAAQAALFRYRHDTWPQAALAAICLTLVLMRAAPCIAQQSVAVGLTAGETYVLKGLDKNSTPMVRFSDNPHSFVLECGAPGNCSVIGAEAGHGSVEATLADGKTILYDISVAAVAHPGRPLEPGKAPGPVGDVFGPKPAGGVNRSSAPAPAAAGSAPVQAASAEAKAPVNEPPPGSAAASDRAAVVKYTRNPAANELEVPPTNAPIVRHYLPAHTVKLSMGTSRIFDFLLPLRRVAIADTDIADVTVVNPNQLMVVAHKAGATTLSVWEDDGQYFERPVRVEDGGPQRVELHVIVAELNRTRLESQGLDISAALANAGVAIVGLQGNVATPYSPTTNLLATSAAGTLSSLPPNGVFPPGGQLIPLLLSNSITYGFTSQNGQWTTNAMFQILEQHDLAKILAEPMLVADSGQPARFLSGGEIPIVIAQALNTSIVFKQFGTSVKFVPTVIDNNEIDLSVSPEFSQPDYSQGVELYGFTVPAFITRRAETRVRMKQNQTLIIAGLILDNIQSEVRKTPYLGDIPYFGYLFKHTYYKRLKTELVMTVTPKIIRPIAPRVRVPLPTDRGPMTPEEIRTRPLSQPDAARPRFR